MEQQRTLLLIALFIVMFLLWNAWQRDYVMPKPATTTSQSSPQQAIDNKSSEVPTATNAAAPSAEQVKSPVSSQPKIEIGQRIHVRTDFMDVELDSRGGDVRRVGLLKYPVSSKEKDKPLLLMNDQPPHLFIAQDGFASKKQTSDGSLTSAPEYRVPGRCD